ncbi:zf-HC2 domain-containing protein [Myxococcus sp. K15C18031901]|uniref:zf-HC2 domain-containing protein n=1 Tax=Myxococcus dinghuensis TaxID=2906761 RepID=UPI0020A790DA|nr:zf-HC2 domain-containing protein [Myxococcus dinghuensis]MCP3097566.1 zf-HC2 domain-containing protein [Myxococcus dinghuensis]
MAACADQEERLDLHAAGALDTTETVVLLQHLESCEGCRDALRASMEVLSLAALPPPSPAERSAREALPRRALSAWKREQTRHALRRRTLGSLAAVAAVAAVMVLGPWRPAVSTNRTPDSPTAPVENLQASAATDEQTMADFEEWAGLEPLETTDVAALDDDALFDDVDAWDDDFELGETL